MRSARFPWSIKADKPREIVDSRGFDVLIVLRNMAPERNRHDRTAAEVAAAICRTMNDQRAVRLALTTAAADLEEASRLFMAANREITAGLFRDRAAVARLAAQELDDHA
jgi:hypothetical protein